uniref:transposase n=1 Tax=Enterococcus innesii TaxID=2839759 RepID=UPI0034A59E65
PYFHELVEAFRDKDPDLFFSLLAELPETSEGFWEKLQSFLAYEEGIINAIIYPYSNGKIEAKNTHIKTSKRVSYGYRNFHNFRARIYGSIIYGTDESELILQSHFHFRY